MFRRGKLAFLNTKDDRIKIINERINLTEKHLMEICNNFSTCTRKIAKYRDSYDELAKSLKHYADEEEINESLCEGLKNCTNAITILGDYMDLAVHRMEIKIFNELAQFEHLCKSTRDNLRLAVIARDKEVLKQRQMFEIKSKFAANNSAADSELVKAKMEVNRTNKEIDNIISNFEKRKLNDIKSILTDFIMITMKYHTKSLEALSASYYDVTNIDERGDFMEFQKLMKTKNSDQLDKKSSKKHMSQLRSSQSMESLDRDELLSPLKKGKQQQRISKSTKNLAAAGKDGAKTEDEEDDNEEDEDDDDDEDEEDDDEDSSENSRSDEDSNTEAENVRGAVPSDNAPDPKPNTFKIKKQPIAKAQVKQPFKAVSRTTTTKTTIVNKRLRNHGAGSSTGIPRLLTNKRDVTKLSLKQIDSKGEVGIKHNASGITKGGGVGADDGSGNINNDATNNSRRMVTKVVESKRRTSLDEVSDEDNIIDCTRGRT